MAAVKDYCVSPYEYNGEKKYRYAISEITSQQLLRIPVREYIYEVKDGM